MTAWTNTRIVLASRPDGEPVADNFHLEETPIPNLEPGQVLLRTLYLSLDPYVRGRMNVGRSYVPPMAIGDVIDGGTVSQVLRSRHPAFQEGDHVLAHSGWQTYETVDGDTLTRRLDTSVAPLTTALGVYGMPGFTAYSGLKMIGQPRSGETLVVAAASGPVGATVGQIAKLQGLRVVGIAGNQDKCDYIREALGFDAALNYHDTDFPDRLRAATPQGIDIYFENVGGTVFEAVMPLLNDFARIPVCGLIAGYNQTTPWPGPNLLPNFMAIVLTRQLTVRGFIQSQFIQPLFSNFLQEMGAWLQQGQMHYREDIIEGLENAADGLIGLLKGHNFGKLLIKVA